RHLLVPHSFPTRRSSDLGIAIAIWPRVHRAAAYPVRRLQLPGPEHPRPFGPEIPLIIVGGTASGERRRAEVGGRRLPRRDRGGRSEEHTSELQSLAYLVC